MRVSLKWLVPAVALVACGGNVIVDGTGAGSTTTTGGSTFSTTFSTTNTCDPGCGGAISSGTFTSSSSSSTSSTSGVTSDCNTCNDWLENGVPTSSICPTGPSQKAFVGLTNCACAGGPCSTSCLGSLCTDEVPGESCNACLMTSCAMLVQFCREN
jgi:hypothetical protein